MKIREERVAHIKLIEELGNDWLKLIKDNILTNKKTNNDANFTTKDIDQFIEEIDINKYQKKYYLTNTAVENLSQIKVQSIDFKIFRYIKEKYSIVVISPKIFVQIWRDDANTKIHFLLNVFPYIGLPTFYKYAINYDEGEFIEWDNVEKNEDKKRAILHTLKIIIYVFLAEPDIIELKAGKKVKKDKTKAYKNESNIDFTVVDSSWNKKYTTHGEKIFHCKSYYAIRWIGTGENKKPVLRPVAGSMRKRDVRTKRELNNE